ncbi:hypothetical protein P3T27_006018 [Kitasatospora sp. MAA19]|uniref:hypothetical protein n=1 Tax=unclassified Kitasatospora TaxID=2633591 RepID=UPI002473C933|nr:hypothetical protein [Kitasatospora sp. MAA19]MDH6709272.1 hypothetical protein [Kitasatospora sp. MAA19]
MKVHKGATVGQLLVSADGRTLTLSIGWSCERQPDLVVRETADTVGGPAPLSDQELIRVTQGLK